MSFPEAFVVYPDAEATVECELLVITIITRIIITHMIIIIPYIVKCIVYLLNRFNN